MVWVDVLILAVVAVSTLISLLRGFFREVLSLVAWVLAFWLALAFAGTVAAHLGFVSESEVVRSVAAFIAIFVGALLVGALVNHLVGALVKSTGLAGTDRVIGMLFGFARGVALVAALMVVGMLAGLESEAWWHQSRLIGPLMPLAAWMHGFLPQDIGATV